jgi:hypothetical protein
MGDGRTHVFGHVDRGQQSPFLVAGRAGAALLAGDRGVCWTSYLTGEWLPGFGGMNWQEAGGALGHSYDDATIRQFVGDTGVKVPGEQNDPERFGKRHDFLTAGDMREKWVAWRCAKVRELFELLKDRVRAVRPDLDLYAALYIDVGHDADWTETGKPLHQYLREWGYDLQLYRDDADLWPVRWAHAIFHSYPAGRRKGWPAALEQTVGKEFIDLYCGAQNRAAVTMHQWNEVSFDIPEQRGWPRRQYTGRLLTQPNGDNARETFTLLLAGTDPQQILYAFTDLISEQDRAHLEGIITLAQRLLQNPDALKQITGDEAEFVKESLETARADWDAGRFAKAWATLTHWRFWNAVALKMKPAPG